MSTFGEPPDQTSPHRPSSHMPTERTEAEARANWVQRRRDKIAAEIERNRRGDYRVPTWALLAVLVAFVAAWALVIVLA